MSFLRKCKLTDGFYLDEFNGALCLFNKDKVVCQVNIQLIHHESVEKTSLVLKTMLESVVLDLMFELKSNEKFMSNFEIKN